MAKDIMLVAAGGALAYQKYGDKVKKEACKVVDNTMDKVNKKLECKG